MHITPYASASDGSQHRRVSLSAVVRERVIQAYQRQQARQGKANNELSPVNLTNFAPLGDAESRILAMAQSRLNLSARGYHSSFASPARLRTWQAVKQSKPASDRALKVIVVN